MVYYVNENFHTKLLYDKVDKEVLSYGGGGHK